MDPPPSLPHHPKDEEVKSTTQPTDTAVSAPPASTEPAEPKGPSKSALKKAAKEAEKAAKAAKRAAEQQAASLAAAASDTAKDLYGPIREDVEVGDIIGFSGLGEDKEGQEVTVIARVDNSRIQSAKLAFLMLRQQGKKVQSVIAAGEVISRQMVKWSGGVNVNSIVQVTGVVRKPEIPVQSATLSTIELHIQKIYLISEAAQMLPMQVKDAERPPPLEADGTAAEGAAAGVDESGAPIVQLSTRLDNRVLDLQTETSQAITWISSGVCQLFAEYMLKHGSRWIHTSKLAGSATEGGSDVFEVSYFKRKAYLSQSPQLMKQMCIAGDLQSVFEIGPVFRAENSNTHRHLTEVSQFSYMGA